MVRDAHRRLHRILLAAMKERDKRNDFVEVAGREPELGWIVFERQAMLDTVNNIRRENTLPVATIDEVERVERQAEGHADYAEKFALYCAELATGNARPSVF